MHDTERIICVLSVFHALLPFQNVKIVAFVANRSFFLRDFLILLITSIKVSFFCEVVLNVSPKCDTDLSTHPVFEHTGKLKSNKTQQLTKEPLRSQSKNKETSKFLYPICQEICWK